MNPQPSILNVMRVALDRADMNYRATGFKPYEIEAAKAWVKAAATTPSAQAAPVVAADLTQAARDVLAERQRQIRQEGYDSEHDDSHVNDEIAALAALFIMPEGAREWDASSTGYGDTLGDAMLPRDWEYPGFGSRRRQLVKGAAMALAELERHDRAAARAQEQQP